MNRAPRSSSRRFSNIALPAAGVAPCDGAAPENPSTIRCSLKRLPHRSRAASNGFAPRSAAARITRISVGQSISFARRSRFGAASSRRGDDFVTTANPTSSKPRLPARPNIWSNSSGAMIRS
ncbi:MAG: hypothetical protein R3F11_19170 [Verrucomicrobiales bacterium]